jgi:hypothetical protein
LTPGVAHMAFAQNIGRGVKIKFGVLSTSLNQTTALQAGSDGVPVSSGGSARASSTMVELRKSVGDAALSVGLLQTSESNAYPGTQSSGAPAFGPKTSTSSIQLSGALLLTPKWVLAGQAAYGLTPGNRSENSVIAEVSDARTNAFSLGLVAADRLTMGDRFSLALSQPLRTYSGKMWLDRLTGISGSEQRERLILSMVPLGREMRVELNYHTPAGKNASAGITLMVRRNPNNQEGPATEKLLALRYIKQF